jgi:hypothetical protein
MASIAVIVGAYDQALAACASLPDMRSTLFGSVVTLVAVVLSASSSLSCSSDDSSSSSSSASSSSGTTAGSVTKTVGPDGAEILVDGATVTIPKGALTTNVEITISASSDPAPAGFEALSKVFKCGPSGTNFAQPVVMKMPFTDDGKPSTMFWSTNESPEFKDVGGEKVNGTMTATVLHFSSGFVAHKK